MQKRVAVITMAACFATVMFGASKKTAVNKEKALWDAVQNHDTGVFEKSLASDYVGVYADGIKDRGQEIAAVAQIALTDYDITDVHSRTPTKDSALITYTIAVKGSVKGRDASGTYYVSALWVSRNGILVNVLHTEIRQAQSGK